MNSLLSAIKAFVLKSRPAYKDDLGNGKYDVKKLPEECVPDSVNDNIRMAQSTADAAQSTADAAQSPADTAKSTADAAKSTAEAAQSTANTAKSTADTAKSTADTAVQPNKEGENKCWYWMDNPYSKYSIVTTAIGATGGTALDIIVNEEYPSVAFVPPIYMAKQADFEFRRFSSTYPHPLITGIGGIVVYSSTSGSTKKFKITVDDTGTISATEVT